MSGRDSSFSGQHRSETKGGSDIDPTWYKTAAATNHLSALSEVDMAESVRVSSCVARAGRVVSVCTVPVPLKHRVSPCAAHCSMLPIWYCSGQNSHIT